MDNDIKSRRSKVRINVTYIAAAFIFIGGAAIIAYGIITKDTSLAKDTFNVVLPVGTAVVTYWFAGRSAEKVAESGSPTTNEEPAAPQGQGDNK